MTPHLVATRPAAWAASWASNRCCPTPRSSTSVSLWESVYAVSTWRDPRVGGRTEMSSLALFNVGRIISGDLDRGLIEAETVLIEDGVFTKIGSRAEIDAAAAGGRIDGKGRTLGPRLIDNTVH